jgi:hypothetical protein
MRSGKPAVRHEGAFEASYEAMASEQGAGS